MQGSKVVSILKSASSLRIQWSYPAKLASFINSGQHNEKVLSLRTSLRLAAAAFIALACTPLYLLSLLLLATRSLATHGTIHVEDKEFLDFYTNEHFHLFLRPHAAFTHAIQYLLFKRHVKESVIDLEVGIDNGETTAYYFRDRLVKAGVEYCLPTILGGSYPNIENVYSMDIRRLAFFDGSQKVVTAVHVLDHIPSAAEALREISRILCPGGVFYFSSFADGYHEINPVYRIMKTMCPQLAQSLRASIEGLWGHYNTLSKKQWITLIEECGFEVEVCESFVGKGPAGIWFALFWLASLGGSHLLYLLDKVSLFDRFPGLARACAKLGMQIFYPFYLREKASAPPDGVNIFFKVRKKGNPDAPPCTTPQGLRCLRCDGLLEQCSESLICNSCGTSYPCYNGIPLINEVIHQNGYYPEKN